MSDATTPVGETNPRVSPLPASSAGPQSCEDCLVIINSLENESDINAVKGAAHKLKTFFNERMARKSNDRAKDGSHAVKQAVTGGRTFKRYEPKSIDSTPAGASPWA